MSIIIKANQLNTLIYKYFLEAGLSHSAYTLFNEAALAHPLQEFRFDVKAGHLLSILQKGLVYAKIEAHVNVGEYMDCEEPFFLLKSHTCKMVEKIRKERNEVLKELDESLNDGIRRTNSIYNTAIANRQFEEIVYDSRGGKYFQKFAKIKLPANQCETQNQVSKITLSGSEVYTLLYNPEDYEVDLLKYDSINEEIKVERIFPSVRQGQLARSIDELVTNQFIIQLFDGNQVTLFDLKNEQAVPIEFNLPMNVQLTSICANGNISQLVCFKTEDRYCVVNLNTYRVVRKGEGRFYWRCYDEYLLVTEGQITFNSIAESEPKQIYESSIQWQDIQFNSGKTLFAAISYSTNTMHIYTFQNSTPLFVFSFEDKLLRQALFVTSNSVDYFCWLTSQSVTVFDVTLNAYSKIIEIQEYDSGVRQLCYVRKAEKEEMYLLCLGVGNLLIYDLSCAKIQRIQIESRVRQLKQLNDSRVAMITEGTIYFLVGQYMDPLFR